MKKIRYISRGQTNQLPLHMVTLLEGKSIKSCAHWGTPLLCKSSAFERRSRAVISVTNAALTRQQLSLTSGVLRNARGARWPSFAWAVRR